MRVLLIEDDPAMVRAIQSRLAAVQIALDHAADGNDGLWKALEGSYDVVVLDLMLPGMDGHEVCRELRKHGVWTPVLVLTARTGATTETQALDGGADDYLAKPFNHEVLIARIRALVRRPAAVRGPERLDAGGLTLHPDTRTCTHGDHTVRLTHREFELLALLVRRRGTTVTRQQILDNVWGFDYEGDPNVVEVYVSYLRKKLDRPTGRQHVETIRGLGYRFAGDADEPT